MALTILISKQEPIVTVIQWFLDASLRLDLACGPLLRINLEDFRSTGYGIRDTFLTEDVVEALRKAGIKGDWFNRLTRQKMETAKVDCDFMITTVEQTSQDWPMTGWDVKQHPITAVASR